MPKQLTTSLALTLALFLVASAPLKADVVTVSSVADAEIREFSPTVNFGTSGSVVSGRVGDNPGANMEVRRALFRFDLSEVPAGSTITSAEVTIHVITVPATPANSTFELRKVLAAWNESEVSWNNRLAGTAWETPGVSGTADIAAEPSSTSPVTGAGSYLFASTTALIADVQDWVDDPASNAGWLLKSQDEVTLRTARQFGAREGLSATVATLEIEFTPPAPAEIVLTSVGLTNDAVKFEFNAEAGTTYAVEYRAGINEGSWQTLTNIPAQPATTPIQFTDPLTPSNRIYRVRTP